MQILQIDIWEINNSVKKEKSKTHVLLENNQGARMSSKKNTLTELPKLKRNKVLNTWDRAYITKIISTGQCDPEETYSWPCRHYFHNYIYIYILGKKLNKKVQNFLKSIEKTLYLKIFFEHMWRHYILKWEALNVYRTLRIFSFFSFHFFFFFSYEAF